GSDTVVAGVSYTLDATSHVETLQADAQSLDLTLTGNDFANTIIGSQGDDTLDGAGGADRLVGRFGDDTYVVDQAGDRVIENFGEGTDTVRSAITLTMPSFVEVLVLEGTANLNGSAVGFGNKRMIGNSGNNTLSGAFGNDQMFGGAGNDTLFGHNGIDTLDGGNQNDLLGGGRFDDVLLGGANDDTLLGDEGNDRLDGGTHSDVLIGGLGRDTLIGGPGADRFDFNAVEEIGGDTVHFNRREGDKIDLSTIDANPFAPGNQAFIRTVLGTFAPGIQGVLMIREGRVSGDLNGDLRADFSLSVIGAVTFADIIM
ncbi:MAG TPA: calcium-binding protein, partial [Beijerinckiaceae bacterium]|nr:calcium-binding protein [Beijerinckiaceae bacterium]